jgi:hypothetical protein
MKIQVARFTNSETLEEDINEFLLTINPDMFIDVKYIPGGQFNSYTHAMVIYKAKV